MKKVKRIILYSNKHESWIYDNLIQLLNGMLFWVIGRVNNKVHISFWHFLKHYSHYFFFGVKRILYIQQKYEIVIRLSILETAHEGWMKNFPNFISKRNTDRPYVSPLIFWSSGKIPQSRCHRYWIFFTWNGLVADVFEVL